MPTAPTVEESLSRIRENLDRRVASLGGRIGDHLAKDIGRPGKMLRSRFCLVLGSALGVERRVCEHLGCAVEFVHNASLLHDDCLDRASTRRGAPTPNAQFGDRTGIILGDLAVTEGMQEAARVSPAAVDGLLRAVHEMSVGELQEEFLCGSLNVSLEGYFGIAARKTGALFEWLGRALSSESPLSHLKEDPPTLGRTAGILLQIIDDIHDFTLDEEVAGKPPGQDLVNGRLTLPGILAMDDERTRARFIEIWEADPASRNGSSLEKALAVFEEGGHLERAREIAKGLLKEMLPLVDRLPADKEAAEFRGFIQALVEREF